MNTEEAIQQVQKSVHADILANHGPGKCMKHENILFFLERRITEIKQYLAQRKFLLLKPSERQSRILFLKGRLHEAQVLEKELKRARKRR